MGKENGNQEDKNCIFSNDPKRDANYRIAGNKNLFALR